MIIPRIVEARSEAKRPKITRLCLSAKSAPSLSNVQAMTCPQVEPGERHDQEHFRWNSAVAEPSGVHNNGEVLQALYCPDWAGSQSWLLDPQTGDRLQGGMQCRWAVQRGRVSAESREPHRPLCRPDCPAQFIPLGHSDEVTL